MTTGGLGNTDIGNKKAVKGIALDFYRRLGAHYGKFEQWMFEPHVAQEVLEGYLDNPRIRVIYGFHLSGVSKDGTRIKSVICENDSGKRRAFSACQFIDCSYEGDLMAMAGVSYRSGREDASEYGEQWNGSHLSYFHQFPDGVDPYVVPGRPESGLLWGIGEGTLKNDGAGDSLVQAYNYRICLTDDPDNMIPLGRPENYDSTQFELLARVFEKDSDPQLSEYFIWTPLPGRKTDINNRGPFSTDMIGGSRTYPEASWPERQEIVRAHKDYTLGLLYFYATDPRVPEVLRDEVRRWGLPKDEFVTTGHWTHQLYVRESRRMVGEYVVTQADCEARAEVTDGIAMAAYSMDSHACERIVVNVDGVDMVKNEGDVEMFSTAPYPLSYRCITPKREECTNLLVPVCLSASHIAYGSVRMEPVFLETGQAAGLAASFAGKGSVQDIDVAALQKLLDEDPYLDGRAPDIIIDDDSDLVEAGEGWESVKGWGAYGESYLHCDGTVPGSRLVYHVPSDVDGEYDLYAFQQYTGSEQCLYDVTSSSGLERVEFRRSSIRSEGQSAGEWFHIGTFEFDGGGDVTLTGSGDDMKADALVFVKK